ncbi:hypothetical protein V6N11_004046 [Hibiscus sabdariffa]|uniref:Uncharacterized protein n=1 Tax=Hibiscus sabdariffa TaxID=183260 RepID=A0ABR2SF49_9ROSI
MIGREAIGGGNEISVRKLSGVAIVFASLRFIFVRFLPTKKTTVVRIAVADSNGGLCITREVTHFGRERRPERPLAAKKRECWFKACSHLQLFGMRKRLKFEPFENFY